MFVNCAFPVLLSVNPNVGAFAADTPRKALPKLCVLGVRTGTGAAGVVPVPVNVTA